MTLDFHWHAEPRHWCEECCADHCDHDLVTVPRNVVLGEN